MYIIKGRGLTYHVHMLADVSCTWYNSAEEWCVVYHYLPIGSFVYLAIHSTL